MTPKSSKILPFPFWKALLVATGICAMLLMREYLWYWNETTLREWLEYASVPIVNYFLWTFLLPVVYWIYKKMRIQKSNVNMILIYIGMGALVSVFHESFSYVLYYVPMAGLGYARWNQEVLDVIIMKIPGNVFARFVEYTIIMGVFFAIDQYRRGQQQKMELVTLQNQLTTAQLQSLRAKLQPHFLFNTLNTIGALVEEDQSKAQKTIAQLGQLLRHILDQQDRQQITLEEELNYVHDYLSIEQTRFSDRLKVKYKISEAAKRCLVPNLILQPLIENAIRHGLAPKAEGGEIQISASIDDDKLEIVIEDNGVGMETVNGWPRRTGVGLSNVKERLQQIYPGNHDFRINCEKGKGCEVVMRIPRKLERG